MTSFSVPLSSDDITCPCDRLIGHHAPPRRPWWARKRAVGPSHSSISEFHQSSIAHYVYGCASLLIPIPQFAGPVLTCANPHNHGSSSRENRLYHRFFQRYRPSLRDRMCEARCYGSHPAFPWRYRDRTGGPQSSTRHRGELRACKGSDCPWGYSRPSHFL